MHITQTRMTVDEQHSSEAGLLLIDVSTGTGLFHQKGLYFASNTLQTRHTYFSVRQFCLKVTNVHRYFLLVSLLEVKHQLSRESILCVPNQS